MFSEANLQAFKDACHKADAFLLEQSGRYYVQPTNDMGWWFDIAQAVFDGDIEAPTLRQIVTLPSGCVIAFFEDRNDCDPSECLPLREALIEAEGYYFSTQQDLARSLAYSSTHA